MYCVKCGQQLPDDAGFCTNCGTKTGSGAGAAASASTGGSGLQGGWNPQAMAGSTAGRKGDLSDFFRLYGGWIVFGIATLIGIVYLFRGSIILGLGLILVGLLFAPIRRFLFDYLPESSYYW